MAKSLLLFCFLVVFVLQGFEVPSVLAVPRAGKIKSAPLPDRKFFKEPQKILWKGYVVLKVTSFDRAREKAIEIARQYGGDSYSEEIKMAHNGRKYGSIFFSVPIKNRNEFLQNVCTLGTFNSQKISAPELTEEFIDLGRRQRNLKAEEAQLLQILKKARHVLEILQVQSHLFNVRVEIERITSRRGEIALKSENALFNLTFFEPESIKMPVYPGGAKEFFPRWWIYTALPYIKSQLKENYYHRSEGFLRFVLGADKFVPNLLLILIFLIVLWVFMKKVWPQQRTALSETLQGIKNGPISFQPIFWSFLFIYLFYQLFPPSWTFVLVSFFLSLGLLNFSKTEYGKRSFAFMKSRNVNPVLYNYLIPLPFALSLIKLIFPALFWSICLLSVAFSAIAWAVVQVMNKERQSSPAS